MKVLREVLGIGSDADLPKDANDKLISTELKAKINNSSSQIPQLEAEKNQFKQERDEAKAKLQAQSDYDAIKTERDQLKQNFQAIVKKLGLADQSTQDQILTKIEQLMNKPDNDNSDKISDLERRLTEKDQRISKLENEKKRTD